MKKLRAKSFRDYSKGTWIDVQNTMVPENSVKLGMNLDSDDELGSLVSRYGTTLIDSQIVDDKPVLGLHNYRDSINSNDVLFAVVSDGTNNDIYDAEDGSKSLEDDTKDLKTRFLTYLNACLRLNGTDAAKYYNGTTWQSSPTGANFTAATNDVITDNGHGLEDGDIIVVSSDDTLPAGLSVNTKYYVRDKDTNTFKVSTTSGGTAVDITDTGTGTHTWAYWDPFDIANLPTGAKYALEFKDRVYVAGMEDTPDRVDISGIASPTTNSVSWTTDNKYIIFEQEDGGGGITGIGKVPGYFLAFKKRTLKRYDGSSAYPEDMINEGAPSQEAIVISKTLCWWVNENGAWVTAGGKPKKISTYTVDKVIKSCSSTNLANVASGTDEEHVYWSFASVTIEGETYTNVVLKYNIDQNTWDVRKYPTLPRVFTKFVDSDDAVFTVFGDDDGNVQKLDVGNTDNGTAIAYKMVTHEFDFGLRLLQKMIPRMGTITENISKGELKWRNKKRKEEWKEVGPINEDVTEFKKTLKGNFFQFQITNTTTTGREKILGLEFPEGIMIYDNKN